MKLRAFPLFWGIKTAANIRERAIAHRTAEMGEIEVEAPI